MSTQSGPGARWYALQPLFQGFLRLLYPGTCWVCGSLVSERVPLLCDTCTDELTHDPHPTCPRCSSTVGPFVHLDKGCPACRGASLAFDRTLRLGPYDARLREVILRMKTRVGEDLVEVMGTVWARRLAARLRDAGIAAVVPVPLHWWRRWNRGFNQSEILAHCMARELDVPCKPGWLRCVRRTSEQKGLSASARRENVRDAFRASARAALAGKTVLLVDDVMTTGATAHEAARRCARAVPPVLSLPSWRTRVPREPSRSPRFTSPRDACLTIYYGRERGNWRTPGANK